MTNYNPSRMNNSRMNTHFNETPKTFKIMFRVVLTFVVLIFAAAITILVMTFTGNAPYSYHYEVNYGNGGYSETSTWDNN